MINSQIMHYYLSELIQEAQNLKLYLVEEKGPVIFFQIYKFQTTFSFVDNDGKKFNVHIGESILCNCKKRQIHHCVHTLYAMINNLKVDSRSQILYKGTYKQEQINDILNGKYQQGVEQFKLNLRTQFDKQQPLEDDTVCPICQDVIKKSDQVTFCKQQCGINIHLKCMSLYINLKKKQGKNDFKCPICRSVFKESNLIQINKTIKRPSLPQKPKFQLVTCHTCFTYPISGPVYHCIQCIDSHQCQKCYDKKSHNQGHNKFLIRRNAESQWKPSKQLISRNRNLNGQKLFYFDSFPQKQQSNNTQTQLQICGQSMVRLDDSCSYCNQKSIHLKQLHCGHLVDYQCFDKLMENGFVCCFDGQINHPGYFKLLDEETKLRISQSLQKNINEQMRINQNFNFSQFRPATQERQFILKRLNKNFDKN